MIHRFEDAAFVQDKLMHNIAGNGYLAKHCDGYQASRYPELPSGVIRGINMHMMRLADPIYVSDDVMTIWERASETFEPEVVRRDDLVVPAGFALLPRPFPITDIHGLTVCYRALGWLPISPTDDPGWHEGTQGQGVWISLFSHIDDPDDYWDDADETWEGEWAVAHGAPLIFEQNIIEDIEVTDPHDGNVLEGEKLKIAASVYTHVQCFWRLMSQVVNVQEKLPRQARRQRQREKRVDEVKVLRLRRARTHYEHEGEGEGIEYSHRFIVEGHWRKQPYGPRNDPYYKQIWIAPYVKGPEDKPLIVKKRGVEFVR